MRVLLISTNQSFSPVPVMPLGACIVAEAAERSGHQVSLLDLMFRPDPERTVANLLRGTDFDVIGLSVRNIDNNDMQNPEFYLPELRSLVNTIRRHSQARLVLGGAAVRVMPEKIMHFLGIDCAVLGDGETAFPALLSAWEQGNSWEDLPGIASEGRGGLRQNCPGPSANRAAVPSYARWLSLRAYRMRFSTAGLQTKLGCAFNCVYCTYPKIEGKGYRLFEPENIADSALRLASSGLRDIEFVDNVFSHPQDHAMQVCESLIRRRAKARFQSVELNPASFDDQLVSAMEKAGFVGMGMTVESASDQVLHRLRKGFTAEDVHRSAGIVKRHDIPCIWIFLLGGPGETKGTVKETLRFAQEKLVHGRDAAFFGIGIRIYPGTELEAIARREGVLPSACTDMLAPVFYLAPGLDIVWLREQVGRALGRNMNFISSNSFANPFLPFVSRLAYGARVRPPLWRHTAAIRRGLRFLGVNA